MAIAGNIKGGIRSDDGFSLLEVLLTLAIVSLLFVVIFQFSAQFRKINELTLQTTEKGGISALENYLRRVVGDARPLPLVESSLDDPKYLVGTGSSIAFVSEAKYGTFSEGLFDITIYVDSRSSTLFQSLRFRRFRSVDKVEETKIPIYEGVRDFHLSYADIAGDGDAVEWENSWNSPLSLPLTIRMTGEIEAETRTYKLDLVIPMNGRKALGSY